MLLVQSTQNIANQPRVDPKFAVKHPRGARACVEEHSAQMCGEQKCGITIRGALNEHCNKYTGGIHHSIKFFLSWEGPKMLQDYPTTPTPAGMEALYWVERWLKKIIKQLGEAN